MDTEQKYTSEPSVPQGRAVGLTGGLLLVLVSMLVMGLVSSQLGALGAPHHLSMLLASLLGIGGVAAVWARLMEIPLRLRLPTVGEWGWGVVIGTGLALVGSSLVLLAISLAPDSMAPLIEARQAAYRNLLRAEDWRWIPVVVLVVCLVPAWTEELLYRRVLVAQLAPFPMPVQLTVGALLFAAVHVDPFSLVPLTLVAIVMHVVQAQRDWTACVPIHIMLNFWGSVLTPRLFPDIEPSPTTLAVCIALGLLWTAAATWWMLVRGSRTASR